MVSKITSLNRTALFEINEKWYKRKTLPSLLAIAIFLLCGNVGFSQNPIFTTPVVCPGTTTVTLPMGGGTIIFTNANIPGLLNVSASDPGGGTITYSTDVASVDCSDVGAPPIPITVTATNDVAPNETTDCLINTTVISGGGNPTAVCQNITVNLSGGGMVVPADIDGGSSSCSGITSMMVNDGGGAAASKTYVCGDVGTQMLDLEVTDAFGMASCTATITVVDDVDPTFSCPAGQTVFLNGSCEVVIPDLITGIVDEADACGAPTMSQSMMAGATVASSEGATVNVTITATDVNMNTATCIVTLTADDNTPPGASCQNITVDLDAAGMYVLTAAEIDGGSSDNCGTANLSIPATTFTCADIAASPVSVTLTVDDGNGNMNTCMAQVTVEDNTPPVALSDLTVNNLAGNCFATVSWPSPNMDNCPGSITTVYNGTTDPKGSPITVLSSGGNDFADFPVGTSIVRYTLTDAMMNPTVDSFEVNVLDVEPPVVTCGGPQTFSFASCEATTVAIPDYRGLAAVSDNCGGGNTLTQIPAPNSLLSTIATPADGETFTMQIIATDNSANNLADTCTFLVTLNQDDQPVPTTSGGVLPMVDEECGVITITAPTATDACGNVICGDPFPGGVLTPLGGTCAGGVTTTGAEFSTDTPVTIPDLGDVTSVINISGIDPTHTLSDIIVTLDISHTWDTDLDIELISPDGMTSIDLSSDNGGTGDNYTGTIFQDGNPSITTGAPPFIGTFEAEGGSMVAAFSGIPSLNGNWSLNVADDEFILEGTLNFWSIEIVTAPPAGSVTSFEVPVGSNNITWIYDDGSGNIASQLQTFNVTNDIEDPTLTCQDITIELDENGQAEILPSDPIVDLTLDDDAGVGNDLSGPINIGFNFSFFGGNFTQLQVSNNGFITFDLATTDGDFSNDAIPSTAGNNNLIAFAWDDLSPGAGDYNYFTTGVAPNRQFVLNYMNIPHFLSTASVSGQVVLHEGSNIIEIFSADVQSDGGGMTQGVEFITGTVGVTVPGRNNTPWTAMNDYVAFVPGGPAGYTVDQSGAFAPIANPVSAEDLFNSLADNCDPNPMVGLSQTMFDCADVGTVNVTVTATDADNNMGSCVSVVTVEDNMAPDFAISTTFPVASSYSCTNLNDTTFLNTLVTTSDNCTPNLMIGYSESSSQSANPNACGFYNYTITKTWTATDDNNNSSSISQLINLLDDDAPFSPGYMATGPNGVITNGATISTNANDCFASVTISMSSIQDCAAIGNLTIINSNDAGGQTASGDFAVGPHTITYTTTDPCGNSSSHNFSFTVIDNLPPVASCVNSLNLGLPASGTLILSPNAVDNNSFDNCTASGDLLLSVTPSSFNCSNVGSTIPVVLTVEDETGASSSCNTTVSIQENNNPTAFCQSITVSVGSSGSVTISPSDIDAGSFDDCALHPTTPLSVSPSTFTTADINPMTPNTVTLIVTDAQNNASSCTAIVTVTPPPTCFHIGAEVGAAGDIVSVPVSVSNFTSVTSFQFTLELDSEPIGEFAGINDINPALNNLFLDQLIVTDSFITSIDTMFVPDVMGNDSIAAIDTSYMDLFDNISVSWQQLSGGPVTLMDDDIAFYVDILLTGNLMDFSFISPNPNLNNTPPEVVFDFSSNLIQTVPCFTNGGVQIGVLFVNGDIYNEFGHGVNLVDVTLDKLPALPAVEDIQITDPTGAYSFTISANGDYTVKPSKNFNWSNGIDILDVAGIQRHAVGNQFVSSAYKKIAADVSDDRLITTFDAVLLNQYLSSAFTSPPPPNESWRFSDAKEMLPYVQNAIVPSYTDSINFFNLNSDSLGNDFIAIKIGDIAGLMADTLQLSNGSGDTRSNELQFVVEDRPIKAGELYTIDVRANDFAQLIGYQWVLKFDQQALAYRGIDRGTLTNLSDANIGLNFVDEGQLIMTWYDAYATDAAKDEVLFTLSFEAKQDAAKLSQLMSRSSLEQLPAIAYNEMEDPIEVDLIFTEFNQPVDQTFALFQNQPNPFKGQTAIGFNLPEATEGTLSIIDLTGRVLRTYEGDFAKGYNEMVINRSDLPASGVLYYQLETADNTASLKMIIIE